MALREWMNQDKAQASGRDVIHGLAWRMVTVTRSDQSDDANIGVSQELDSKEVSFTIRARIDMTSPRKDTQRWIGLVHSHDLASVKKGDHWIIEEPSQKPTEYIVMEINADEIMLEKK